MEALKRSAAVLLVAVAVSACSSGDHDRTKPDADVTEPEPDSEVDAGDPEPDPDPEPEVDAGKPTDELIPLSVWVDDMIDHDTNGTAEPDEVTVTVTKITDDGTESSFDKYLPK
jgi:hypothetical protein